MKCLDCGAPIFALLPSLCDECGALADHIYAGGREGRIHWLETHGKEEVGDVPF